MFSHLKRLPLLLPLSLFLTSSCFAQASPGFAVYDVDQNYIVSPESDGQIILQILLGQPTSSLEELIDPNGERTNPKAIKKYVKKLRKLRALDVDGNGKTNPLNDGVLIMRRMSGLKIDSDIIAKTVDRRRAIRKTPNSLVTFIDAHLLQ